MLNRIKRRDDEKKSFWKKLVDLALTDVRVAVGGMDHESLETLEERLLQADFGVTATLRLVERVEDRARQGKVRGGAELREALREEVRKILGPAPEPLRVAAAPPTVYLIVGVNGVGKTTSIGKLAHRLKGEGRKVLLAAGDTWRAGAVEQLARWGERAGVEVIRGQQGGDPAAVAFDALEAAERRGCDTVIVDTAGRLHTQKGLMDELRKVDRVIRKKLDGAPHETLIVLDATVGQNALRQAQAFGEAVDLTGIILAKADSTGRGGIVVALKAEQGLPVRLVGLGEGIDDLEPFDPEAFLDGVFEE
jgi:fused signal recognition particle receptor